MCCSESLNQCCPNGSGCGAVDYCTDRTATGDFVFGLSPQAPARFDPTGANTDYQYVRNDRWPAWATYGDINMGSTVPGASAQCQQGGTYNGNTDQICGGGHGTWGTTSIEVWRRLRTCTSPCADGQQCVDGTCLCVPAGQDMATVGQWATNNGGVLSVCLADDAAVAVGSPCTSAGCSPTVTVRSGNLTVDCGAAADLCQVLDRIEIYDSSASTTLAHVLLQRLKFSGLSAIEGGAVYVGTGASLSVFGAMFDGNSAARGGGIQADNARSLSVVATSFIACITSGGQGGGGILIYNMDGLS